MSPSHFSRRGVSLPPTTTEAAARSVIYSTLTVGARANGELFSKPDDDWVAVWLVLTADGHGTMLSGNAHKHEMARAAGAFARRVGAVAIGHLASAWTAVADAERATEIQRHIKHQGSMEGIAERREALVLMVYTVTTWEQHIAMIERHESVPPTLAAFELVSSSVEADSIEGAMVEPLQQALVRLG